MAFPATATHPSHVKVPSLSTSRPDVRGPSTGTSSYLAGYTATADDSVTRVVVKALTVPSVDCTSPRFRGVRRPVSPRACGYAVACPVTNIRNLAIVR